VGRDTFSRAAYTSAKSNFTSSGQSATSRGKEAVKKTGKLDPLVDPAGFGVIRESRIRLEEQSDGLWSVTVGTPVPIEYRLDTTGSMEDNVDRALSVLPNLCEPVSKVLPGRDPHYCASIFADVQDEFILCRGQFEMLAERMVNQLTLMHPEGGGYGNYGEDPQFGLFGATYLTKAYLQRIGMKSYDFTLTDEPVHENITVDLLKRVFGPHVMEKVKENGYEMSPRDLPTLSEMVSEMFKRVHAFCLIIGDRADARRCWLDLYGENRVIFLGDVPIEYAPQTMAAIIGLTEGTLDLKSTPDFLTSCEVKKEKVRMLTDAISGIPIGAQRVLPNFSRLPKAGDLFAKKTDLWPVDPAELSVGTKPGKHGKHKKPHAGSVTWL
jgi:hypothetical protein